MPRIFNGPHEGPPLATLTGPDGSLIDLYEPADLLGAIDRILGSPPAPPVLGMGYFDEQTTVYQFTNADGSTTLVPITQLSYIATADSLNAGLAAEYEAQAATWNTRAQIIKDTALPLWPYLIQKEQEMADPRFKRGAILSPRHKLLATHPHVVVKAPPPQFALVPQKLDMWGNDQLGDCVTAEEAFAKATYSPEIFLDAQLVIDWAKAGGFADGATLTDVMDKMQKGGFVVGSQTYDDGPYTGVDYSNETVLQSAISQGTVKIAIDANALPGGAGNQMGWSAFGGSPGQFTNTDHCVSVPGYGPVAWLAQQLGVQPPANAPANGYLLYTWKTIGIVDHAWLMSTCTEAWLRNPTTVGVPPLPGPTPTPTPTPPTPTPVPPMPGGNMLMLATDLPAGNYPIGNLNPQNGPLVCQFLTILSTVFPQAATEIAALKAALGCQ